MLEIDGSAGAVILTSGVDSARIFEAAQIFSIGFRRDGLRNQSAEAAGQEELGAVANERFRQGRGLDQRKEEPVIVRGREGLVHMLEHVISRHNVEKTDLGHLVRVIERKPVRHPAPTVVADNGEFFEA